MPVDIKVTYKNGAYVTNTVRGVRASSTASAKTAAERFGEKYFGPSFLEVSAMPKGAAEDHTCDVFLVHCDPRAVAWCWQTGRIEIGDLAPEGALAFAYGPRRALEEQLSACARHGKGKSKGLLLVPGVPEAETPDAAVQALIGFTNWRAKANGRHQVFFARSIQQ